jgi:hypothetical protein
MRPDEETDAIAQKLRETAADNAAYEIANGLREILSEREDLSRQGSDRLRDGLREALLLFLPPPMPPTYRCARCGKPQIVTQVVCGDCVAKGGEKL